VPRAEPAAVDPAAAAGSVVVESAEPALPHPRGWRQRWLPVSWRGARTDPRPRGAIALAGVAAAAAALAAVGVWRDRPIPQPIPALLVVAVATTGKSAPPPQQLVVSVAGAVVKPGLVTVPAEARVADALAAAGGALPGTDLLALDLAQRLTDGEQVLVGVGGNPVGGNPVGGVAAAPASGPGASGGVINLNKATVAELDTLPGVGPVMAQAIVDWRTENGGFTDVAQLNDVSGIGDARFAQLKDLVRV